MYTNVYHNNDDCSLSLCVSLSISPFLSGEKGPPNTITVYELRRIQTTYYLYDDQAHDIEV